LKKGDYERIEDKIDKHTAMLIAIQVDIAKEISLIKLAHQKLKYMVIVSSVTIGMTLGKPELSKLIPLLF
tara:strand:- start:487 stop:696 length:210 start_codon:yes stop_codon:yes gene_type:complete